MRRFLNVAVGLLALLSLTASTYVRNWYDVLDYGARPDDLNAASRNAAIFNQCIAAANSNGGGVVYVPEGLWYVDSPITMKSNVDVCGLGPNATRIRTTVDTMVFNNVTTDSLRNWKIRDLAIQGTSTSPSDSANQHGIYFYLSFTDDWHDASFWTIENVNCWFLGGHGIWLRTDPETCDGSWNCQYFNEGYVEKVNIKKVYGHALLLEGNMIDLHFTDSYFQNDKDSCNARFLIPIDNDTTGGSPDTVLYSPAVCIIDSCYNDEPAQWAECTGPRFTRCALQTTYQNTALTPDQIGLCLYTRNINGAFSINDCWFECGGETVPYRAIYADSLSCTFKARAALTLDGCKFSGFTDTDEIVNLDIEWDAMSIGACEWPSTSARHLYAPSYEPYQKPHYPGFMYFDVSESTFIFWNGSQWDTLTSEQRP